ncbi:TPA: hypothetical protein QCY53_003993 [Bacillus wiedmannii]|nr:hypothetical protein [Bacillus wiedmannii]
MYLTIPQLLDFLLFEQRLRGKEYTDEEFINIFGHSMLDEKMKVARNILSFVKNFCGIDWKDIWEKPSNKEEPKVDINETKANIAIDEKAKSRNQKNNEPPSS